MQPPDSTVPSKVTILFATEVGKKIAYTITLQVACAIIEENFMKTENKEEEEKTNNFTKAHKKLLANFERINTKRPADPKFNLCDQLSDNLLETIPDPFVHGRYILTV